MNRHLKQPKRRGEWVEMLFATEAAARGFTVTKPWGESTRYDLILEKRGRCLRIQVKSTGFKCRRYNSYACGLQVNRHMNHYNSSNVDFLAIYILQKAIWYILPIRIIKNVKANLTFSPQKKDHKYEAYLDAWHLLECSAGGKSKQPVHRKKSMRGLLQPAKQAMDR